jgi:hypothetical protein
MLAIWLAGVSWKMAGNKTETENKKSNTNRWSPPLFQQQIQCSSMNINKLMLNHMNFLQISS